MAVIGCLRGAGFVKGWGEFCRMGQAGPGYDHAGHLSPPGRLRVVQGERMGVLRGCMTLEIDPDLFAAFIDHRQDKAAREVLGTAYIRNTGGSSTVMMSTRLLDEADAMDDEASEVRCAGRYQVAATLNERAAFFRECAARMETLAAKAERA